MKCSYPWSHGPHPHGKLTTQRCPGHTNPLQDPQAIMLRKIREARDAR